MAHDRLGMVKALDNGPDALNLKVAHFVCWHRNIAISPVILDNVLVSATQFLLLMQVAIGEVRHWENAESLGCRRNCLSE